MTRAGRFLVNLQAILDERGISHYKLAAMLEKDEAVISRLFNRDSYPDMDTIDQICLALGIGLGDIFAYDRKVVDYEVIVTPDDIKLIEIRHQLDERSKGRLQGYADALLKEKTITV